MRRPYANWFSVIGRICAQRQVLMTTSVVFLGLLALSDEPSKVKAQMTDQVQFSTVAQRSTTMQSLKGTNWTLSSWTQEDGARPLGGAREAITVAFSDGTISGSGGCNRFSGSYRWLGNRLNVSELIASTIACEPSVMAREASFMAALAAIQSVEVSDGGLRLGYNTEVGKSGTLIFQRGGSLSTSVSPPPSRGKCSCSGQKTSPSSPMGGSTDQLSGSDTSNFNRFEK